MGVKHLMGSPMYDFEKSGKMMPMKARTVYFRLRRSKQSSIPTDPNQSFNWNNNDILDGG